MEREDLETSGEPLQTIISLRGGNITQYYKVQCDGYLVGVGIYHNHNTTCTFALVKVKEGGRHMLGRISDEFPLEVNELHQLETYFRNMFPT